MSQIPKVKIFLTPVTHVSSLVLLPPSDFFNSGNSLVPLFALRENMIFKTGNGHLAQHLYLTNEKRAIVSMDV